MALISSWKAVATRNLVAVVLIPALVLIAITVAVASRPRPVDIKVGYKAYAPFVMVDQQGQRVGLAVEIITEAARRANIRLRWVEAPRIDEALRAGKIDMFPLLALTKERIAEFHPSHVWWETETALVSLQSTPVLTPSGAAGKKIAIRGLPALKALAERLFTRSFLSTIPNVGEMVDSLCSKRVDAAFLDVKVLQAELLKGPRACAGQPLHIVPVGGGNLQQGTIARKEMGAAADRIYEQIALLANDGTLSEAASRWSMVSTFRNPHSKELLEAQERARMMRFGLLGLTLALILTWYQSRRVHRARRTAEENRARFDAFMKYTPAVTFITDDTGKLVYVNEAISRSFEMSPHDVAEQFVACRSAAQSVPADSDSTAETTETITLPSGEQRQFLCVEFPFSNAVGQKLFGSVALDITERLKAEEALRLSQFSIEQSPDSILWIDSDERIFYANQAACKALGYERKELLGSSAGELDIEYLRGFSGHRAKLRDSGSISLESTQRARDGEPVTVEVGFYFLELDGKDFTCCISRNITERKLAEQELSYQANHDALTGLPNRRYFESELENRVAEGNANGTGLALFYFDIDGFKKINDSLGHSVGDAILIQVVRRYEGCIRENDTMARIGGDEFTLLAPGVTTEEDARAIAEKLSAAMRPSFFVEGHEVTVTASIGISLFPLNGQSATDLLQDADAAMYEAKRRGKNSRRFFQLSVATTSLESMEPLHRRRDDEEEAFEDYILPTDFQFVSNLSSI